MRHGSSILAILKYWDHVDVGCVDVSRKAVDVVLEQVGEEDLSRGSECGGV